MDLTPIAQQGGFAFFAVVCIWAIVAIVKIGVSQMEKSHLREIESLKIIASDRGEMLRSYIDVMMEVRSSLVSLQDEINQLLISNGIQMDRRKREKES